MTTMIDERSTKITKPENPPPVEKLLDLVETTLEDDKAEQVVVIELTGKTEIADYLVVASGTSQRHVSAMSDHLHRSIKAAGVKSVAIEGHQQCDWVLLDAGDIIVHLFRPEVREFYNLEKIWTTPGDVPTSETATGASA